MKRRIREELYCNGYNFFFLWDIFKATHNFLTYDGGVDIVQWAYPGGDYMNQSNLLNEYIEIIKLESEKQIIKKKKQQTKKKNGN